MEILGQHDFVHETCWDQMTEKDINKIWQQSYSYLYMCILIISVSNT